MSAPTFLLNLSYLQRRLIVDLLPSLADRLKTDEAAARRIPLTHAEMEEIAAKCQDAVPRARKPKIQDSLQRIVEVARDALENHRGIGRIPASERLFQFKITLKEIKPPIWRRIQVKDCTLDKLHERIQTAMGWTNSHLHQFKIGGVVYGDPELLCEGWQDETLPVNSLQTKISKIVPRNGKPFHFEYEYDFGDGWEHEVVFEGCLRAETGTRYPLCLEGDRACPPEDVGGVGGYEEYLEALADPKHKRHEEFMEWRAAFDPEAFDAQATTKRMRRGLPNWRNME